MQKPEQKNEKMTEGSHSPGKRLVGSSGYLVKVRVTSTSLYQYAGVSVCGNAFTGFFSSDVLLA